MAAAGGLATAGSVTQSAQAATLATSLSATLSGLVLATVSYPSSVTGSVQQISAWAVSLTAMATLATSHAKLLTTYSDPSLLIQLTTGWDVYCRANSLASSEIAISSAIGDSVTPAALVAALKALGTSALNDAMRSINTTLSATTTTTGTTATAPTLSDSQVKALASAVTAFKSLFTAATSALNALSAKSSAAANSATTAQAAYSNAIAVALISASARSPAVSSAVNAITPASVLSLLE
ncbi:hypothetical protein CYR55_22805 [Chimaeribacter californicus]|uniref:Uncharacterized protein n=1 Tax=Chimaeribacter californicus TaxID=2060067 RepID=A0A2N5DSZ2_9GAMM|nr:hypothetical protein CYR55_22805 [Chimaeribacter californicus]